MEQIIKTDTIELAKNQVEQASAAGLGRLAIEAANRQITAEQRIRELLSRRMPSVFIG